MNHKKIAIETLRINRILMWCAVISAAISAIVSFTQLFKSDPPPQRIYIIKEIIYLSPNQQKKNTDYGRNEDKDVDKANVHLK